MSAILEPMPEAPPQIARGVPDEAAARRWCRERRIDDIECIIPDQAGVARGKLMPTEKFFGGNPMTLPASMFTQTITGEYPEEEEAFIEGLTDSDLIFRPDFATLAGIPWASDPTAQVIHDAFHKDGTPFEIAPRNVLKRVVQLYAAKGWRPVVAPEMEFYLVKPNIDPDYPLEPPIGRSGRPERARQAYSITAVNEFEELFDDIYRFSEAQGLEIDTLNHEDGTAQMEINLRHGDPLELADQVFLFKRTIREAALRHKMYATFMAKPIATEPGSAMHIHHSVSDAATGRNIFADGGVERARPALPELRRRHADLPAEGHVHAGALRELLPPAGHGTRARRSTCAGATTTAPSGCACRSPMRRTGASRTACRRPTPTPISPSPPRSPAAISASSRSSRRTGRSKAPARTRIFRLPRSILDAVRLLELTPELVEIFGATFVRTYRAIKETEYETFMGVISPWEREYLLLSV